MENYKLGVMETKFAELIWDHEPIPSGDLVGEIEELQRLIDAKRDEC